jgi:hypothetical protein
MHTIDPRSPHAGLPGQRRGPNFLRLILGFGFALAVTSLILYASVWVEQKDFIRVTAAVSGL